MTRMCRLAVAVALLAGLMSGCQTVQQNPHVTPAVVTPAGNEMLVLDDLFIIVDASGSMFPPERFMAAKRLMERFAAAAPEGGYQVQMNSFGGEWKMDWLNMPQDVFDRKKLAANVERLHFLSGETPLAEVLMGLKPALQDGREHAAVLILSDGQSDATALLDAGRALLSAHPGALCFHTVHFGGDEAGEAALQQLATLSDCGTARDATATASQAGLDALVHDVFFGPRVDSDNDGVPDACDLCPDTPPGAKVNLYGCNTWGTIYFDTNKSVVKKGFKKTLDTVAERVKATPGACLRVEGHTDSRNEVAYNQALSERRAEAVRMELIKRGVEPGRLVTTGYSELHPAVPNDSAKNMSLNRRVELIPLP